MSNEFKIKNGLIVNGGITGNTISATTSNTLGPILSGGTDLNNIFKPLNAIDIYVTGGTYSNGTSTFTNNTGGTFDVSGYYTGSTTLIDVYTTGATYSSNTFTFTNNTGGTFSTSFNTVTGLTANTLSTDYVDFNQNYTGATTQGRINWDSGTGTLNIGIGDSGTGLVNLEVGQEEVVRVYNSEATTLVKGEVVYVSGSQGNRPSVKRAIAINDGYSVTTLGMVDRDISSGAEGYVTTFGIISNLNTIGLSGGTAIYLSPTIAGGYTSTKPQAPNHIVVLGYVIRVHASVGSIFMNISNGWEIDELHDVRITSPNLGDLISYSAYNGSNVWVNGKTLNGSYTITGNTTVGGTLKGTTISATTYQNLPLDVYTTGATLSSGTLSFNRNDNNTYSVNLTPIINNVWTASTGGGSVVLSGSNSVASGALSVAEGYLTTASGKYSHAEGEGAIASGSWSHAEGFAIASGNYSHAEGNSQATAAGAHSEGYQTVASAFVSHAEGDATRASGQRSHSEGYQTTASGDAAHAEGRGTSSMGNGSHSEGVYTTALPDYSHTEGYYTTATAAAINGSHAGGQYSVASGDTVFIHSNTSTAIGDFSSILGGSNNRINAGVTGSTILGGSYITGTTSDTVYGVNFNARNGITGTTISATTYLNLPAASSPFTAGTGTNSAVLGGSNSVASGILSYAEGTGTTASDIASHAEGSGTTASGAYAHAEGQGAKATGIQGAHAEGWLTLAAGDYGCHAEGHRTTASGNRCHAEGGLTTALGDANHAQGFNTKAIGGGYGHAEGYSTTSSGGEASHAEGRDTIASGSYSHAGGQQTLASGYASRAIGFATQASATYSFAKGNQTFATGVGSAAQGKYTRANGDYSHVGGIGSTNNTNRVSALGIAAFNHSIVDVNHPLYDEGATGDGSVILGGLNHYIKTGATYSSIIGGSTNKILDNVTGSTVLGGSNITGTTSDTVYGINFNASGNIISGGTNLLNIFAPLSSTADTFTTAFTNSNGLFTITRNDNTTLSSLFNTTTGLTVNGNITITGNTNISGNTNINGTITSGGTNLLSLLSDTGSNSGSGTGIFSGKTGTTLFFKSLTSTGNTVTINSTGSTINLESNPVENKSFILSSPIAGDRIPIFTVDRAATITKLIYQANSGSTTFNVVTGGNFLTNTTSLIGGTGATASATAVTITAFGGTNAMASGDTLTYVATGSTFTSGLIYLSIFYRHN